MAVFLKNKRKTSDKILVKGVDKNKIRPMIRQLNNYSYEGTSSHRMLRQREETVAGSFFPTDMVKTTPELR